MGETYFLKIKKHMLLDFEKCYISKPSNIPFKIVLGEHVEPNSVILESIQLFHSGITIFIINLA
jgi:hypothetical protein